MRTAGPVARMEAGGAATGVADGAASNGGADTGAAEQVVYVRTGGAAADAVSSVGDTEE